MTTATATPSTSLTTTAPSLPVTEVVVASLDKLHGALVPAKKMEEKIRAGVKDITSKEEREALFHLAKDGAAFVKWVEGLRTDHVKAFNDHVSGVNKFAKEKLTADVSAVITLAKDKIKAWDDKVAAEQEAERKRLADEQRQRDEEARREAERIEQERLEGIAAAQAEADRKRKEEIDAMPPGPEKAAALRALRGEVEAKVEEINATAEHGAAHAEVMSHAAHGDLQSSLSKLDADVGRGRQKVWKFEVVDMAALYAARPDLVKAEVKTREMNGEIAGGVREIPGVRIYEDSAVVLR